MARISGFLSLQCGASSKRKQQKSQRAELCVAEVPETQPGRVLPHQPASSCKSPAGLQRLWAQQAITSHQVLWKTARQQGSTHLIHFSSAGFGGTVRGGEQCVYRKEAETQGGLSLLTSCWNQPQVLRRVTARKKAPIKCEYRGFQCYSGLSPSERTSSGTQQVIAGQRRNLISSVYFSRLSCTSFNHNLINTLQNSWDRSISEMRATRQTFGE